MTEHEVPATLADELVSGDLERTGGVEISHDSGETWEVLEVDEESAALAQLPPHPDTFDDGSGTLYRRTAP